MQLISINAGKKQELNNKGRLEITGIHKTPLQGEVPITTLGIMGDFIGSPKHHGGPDQALYVYGEADYNWWAEELGQELMPGLFGENLTISQLAGADFNIGDMLHIGEVTLQVTAPRIPCGTFASHMADPQWVKKFTVAERPGFYVRVLKVGTLTAAQTVQVEKYNGEKLSLVQVYRDHYAKPRSEETLRKHLAVPISERMREKYREELNLLDPSGARV